MRESELRKLHTLVQQCWFIELHVMLVLECNCTVCTAHSPSCSSVMSAVLPLPTASGEARDVKLAALGTQVPSARRHAGCGLHAAT